MDEDRRRHTGRPSRAGGARRSDEPRSALHGNRIRRLRFDRRWRFVAEPPPQHADHAGDRPAGPCGRPRGLDPGPRLLGSRRHHTPAGPSRRVRVSEGCRAGLETAAHAPGRVRKQHGPRGGKEPAVGRHRLLLDREGAGKGTLHRGARREGPTGPERVLARTVGQGRGLYRRSGDSAESALDEARVESLDLEPPLQRHPEDPRDHVRERPRSPRRPRNVHDQGDDRRRRVLGDGGSPGGPAAHGGLRGERPGPPRRL